MGPYQKSRLAFVLLLSLLFDAVPGEAATLEATVIGTVQNAKRFVRVEISGPQSMTVFTNNDGKFSVNLPPGQYKIAIIEMNHRGQFIIDMPNDDKAVKQLTFKLAW